MAVKAKANETIEVPSIEREVLELSIVGETPLIFNRMAEKAKRELLFPRGRKTAADKAASMKHDPLAEFRDSVYRGEEDDETLLAFPAPGFKQAMSAAAIRLPGSTKTAIGQLVRVHGYRVPIYGEPMIYMTGVRSADMSRTPDIRTRAIVPDWACRLQVSYVRPLLNAKTITNLLSAAGEIIGVGDFRQAKGAGDYGLFRLVGPDDPEFLRRVKVAREEQVAALKDPQPFDAETRELFEWFEAEVVARGEAAR